MTDLDRLHKVVLGELVGRNCGQTFAKCHELAGHVEVGQDKNIICLVSSINQLPYILPMIVEVFSEHELSLTKVWHNEYKCNNKTISFAKLEVLENFSNFGLVNFSN